MPQVALEWNVPFKGHLLQHSWSVRKFFFSVHELSQAKINVQECSNSFLKKYVNRLRRNRKIRNAFFAHAHFWLFFLSVYAAAAAAAHSAHGRIVVHLFHQWLCFTEQVCRFFKKSRSYRKIFSFIHYTEVFHSRTRSIKGAPTRLFAMG